MHEKLDTFSGEIDAFLKFSKQILEEKQQLESALLEKWIKTNSGLKSKGKPVEQA